MNELSFQNIESVAKKCVISPKVSVGHQIAYLNDHYDGLLILSDLIERYFLEKGSNIILNYKIGYLTKNESSRKVDIHFPTAYNNFVKYANNELYPLCDEDFTESKEEVLVGLYQRTFLLLQGYETSMGLYFRHVVASQKSDHVSAHALLLKSMKAGV